METQKKIKEINDEIQKESIVKDIEFVKISSWLEIIEPLVIYFPVST